MIYAVQVIKTGDWYIVEEKTPARASNYVRDVLGEPDLDVKCDSIAADVVKVNATELPHWEPHDGPRKVS